MNGSGYPQGLTGDRIMMEAKILAVADVTESMSSHRPYRPALGMDAALEEIVGNRGFSMTPRQWMPWSKSSRPKGSAHVPRPHERRRLSFSNTLP